MPKPIKKPVKPETIEAVHMNGGATEEEEVKVNGDVTNGGVENGHVNGIEANGVDENLDELQSDGGVAPLL